MVGAIALFLSVIVGVFSISLGYPEAALAETQQSTAPEGARVYIIAPADGATVTSNVTVKFGLQGMGIAPAGVDIKNTGHHHLLIDVTEPPDVTEPLPANDHIKHFGAGQTETELTLDPGKHTLQLILGNYAHIPHDKPVISTPVTITVED
ncbi:MAG: DUF4399 domain-containing protein [Okeania sp. SIO2G5]|nr:DUF4399 domain-containing protein [Okeania sp. SIO2G5]